MTDKNSLKHQFKKQLAISVGILVIVFSFLIYQLFLIGINTTMNRTMMTLANHYVKQLERNKHFKLPRQGAYTAFVGWENMPSRLTGLFDADKLADFKLSVNDGGLFFKLNESENRHFIFTHPINNTNEKLYLVYTERNKERAEPANSAFPSKEQGPFLNVPISIALITLIAIALVYFLAKRLINLVLMPLGELSVMAKKLDKNNPTQSFNVMRDKSEIGMVAKTLHQTMQRMQQYHQREKQFLQNASHELRTPIAVVTSALDIIDLRKSQGNSNVCDQHTHIRRANKNMAELTEALLLLSREQDANDQSENVNLVQLCERLLQDHKYILHGKKVEVEFMSEGSVYQELPLSLCRIVLSNLIRNAFEHTLVGIVCINAKDDVITITNTSSNFEGNYQFVSQRGVSLEQGYGIGLDIVKQIIDQQGWQLHISSTYNDGCQVVISFKKKITT